MKEWQGLRRNEVDEEWEAGGQIDDAGIAKMDRGSLRLRMYSNSDLRQACSLSTGKGKAGLGMMTARKVNRISA